MARILAAASLAFAVGVSSPALAQPPEVPLSGSPLELATRAADDERWHTVVDLLEPVWRSAPSPEIAALLGRGELYSGRPRDAAEHFAYALRTLPLNAGGPRFLAQSGLARARAFIVSLRVVSVAGAEILVDGKSVGKAPLDEELFVDEGGHSVDARLSGYVATSRSFNALMGTARTIEVPLAPERPAPVAAPPPTPPAAPASRSRIPTILGGSLAALTLGAGGGFTVSLAAGKGDPDAMRRDMAIHYTAGGVVLGATLLYAFWPSSHPAPAARFQASPVAFTGGGGVWLTGAL